ncbi:uncharacterized protein BX663DRAFT_410903, partial [Cokeromyces recurvatus]|uniref:uncharacterized protein n=1 Tax=Cokeromyces recurvatus TaxID=90255 RepID=UPI00221F3289
EDLNPFHLETSTNIRHYYNSQGPEQEPIVEDLDTKMQEVIVLAEKSKKSKKKKSKGHYHEYSSE